MTKDSMEQNVWVMDMAGLRAMGVTAFHKAGDGGRADVDGDDLAIWHKLCAERGESWPV